MRKQLATSKILIVPIIHNPIHKTHTQQTKTKTNYEIQNETQKRNKKERNDSKC